MSEKVIKCKSYENLWGSTWFQTTQLTCQPDDVSLLIGLLKKVYPVHGYHIIDSYVVQGEMVCTVEFLLKSKKTGELTIKEEPQLVTDKAVEEYQSQRMDYDDDIEDGIYAIPGEYRTKIRALNDYLNERGISIEDLTPDDWEKFIVKK